MECLGGATTGEEENQRKKVSMSCGGNDALKSQWLGGSPPQVQPATRDTVTERPLVTVAENTKLPEGKVTVSR